MLKSGHLHLNGAPCGELVVNAWGGDELLVDAHQVRRLAFARWRSLGSGRDFSDGGVEAPGGTWGIGPPKVRGKFNFNSKVVWKVTLKVTLCHTIDVASPEIDSETT